MTAQPKQRSNKFGRFQAHHNAPKAQPMFTAAATSITRPFAVFAGRLAVQRRPGVLSPATANDYGDFLRWRASTTVRTGRIPELLPNDHKALKAKGLL